MRTIRRFENAETLSAAVANLLREYWTVSRPGAGRAVMLSGGRTPLRAYDLLAAPPWPAGIPPRVFLSDERHVPVASPDSNTGQIQPRLERAGVSPENWWRVPVELPLDAAAEAYSATLEAGLAGDGVELGLLGLGADGHTASLFSLEHVERGRHSGRLAMAVPRAPGPHRISVTPLLFDRIARVVLLVAGADKAAVVRHLLLRPDSVPAGAAVHGHPNVSLWADDAALSLAPANAG